MYDLDSVGLRYEGFWMKVRKHRGLHWFKDKKHGSGWIIYPDGSQYKGEFINDEPVSDDSRPVERRHSAESRLTVDGESVESSKSDHSRRSATSPSHLAKRYDRLERTIQHERSRSFTDTVGRRINNPVNMWTDAKQVLEVQSMQNIIINQHHVLLLLTSTSRH